MSKNNKKISVVIPCFNCSKYISETLQSLENQSFKDFVVICVNDGSTDDTLTILQKWQNKGTLDLQIINQINSGVSKARNAGIVACQTEFITFCDADDLYDKEYLFCLINAIEKSDSDVAYCYLSRDINELHSKSNKNKQK